MIETEIQPHAIHVESTPAVSVIIPAYNSAEYIGEALDSVFNQIFTSHEVLVINDGSPDTEELERELRAYAGRIRYIKQENRGAAAARNAGLRVARGEFVAFLDADDRWLPNFLADQMEFLRSSDADLVYSDALLSGQSPLAGRSFMGVQPSRGPVTPENLLGVNVTVLTSVVLARKKPILDIGLFDESLKRGHDFELWLRLARAGIRFAYHGKVLGHHRIVETSLSGGTISQLERTLSVLNAIKSLGNLTASEETALLVTWNRTQAQLEIEEGKKKLLIKDFEGAAQSFTDARKLQDSWKLKVVCIGLRIAPGALWWFQHRRLHGNDEIR